MAEDTSAIERSPAGGDAVALDFADCYAANFARLTAQLHAYTGSMAEAQDVVQEAFCRAYARWSDVAEYQDPVAWLRTVAWNLATSRWRRLRRLRALAPELARTNEAPGPSGQHVDLMRALASLTPKLRRAVVLHYMADLSIQEIADMVGAPPGTVKSWLSRARDALQEHLAVVESGQEVVDA